MKHLGIRGSNHSFQCGILNTMCGFRPYEHCLSKVSVTVNRSASSSATARTNRMRDDRRWAGVGDGDCGVSEGTGVDSGDSITDVSDSDCASVASGNSSRIAFAGLCMADSSLLSN